MTAAQQKKVINTAFQEGAISGSQDIYAFCKQIGGVAQSYCSEYDAAWIKFDRAFKIEQQAQFLREKQIQQGKTRINYNSLASRVQGNRSAAVQFIRVLEKGNLILEYIRSQLNLSTINTDFTVRTQQGIYLLSKNQVNYKYSLSSWGASGKNFVSLAYSVNIQKTLDDLKEDVKQYQIDKKELEENYLPYSIIMAEKDKYLKTYYPNALPRYDSKDAEIYEIYKQQHISNEDFMRYAKYRETMGHGGVQATAFQGGDVGLKQEKLVSSKNSDVNFLRQTLIRRYFIELKRMSESITPEECKNILLKLFTQKEEEVNNGISKMTNEEMREIIGALFDNSKNF